MRNHWVWAIPTAVVCLSLFACRTTGPVTEASADPAGCAECHLEVYREWQASTHAKAWVSTEFKKATDDYAKAECLGCHAPESLFASKAGPPAVRTERREHGVDCHSCHVDQGVLVGPHGAQRGALLQAHPIRKEGLRYRTSALCARCHQVTAAEVARFSEGTLGIDPTCQECHMSRVTRKLSGDAASFGDDAVRQRRHEFTLSGLRDSERPIVDVSAVRTREAGQVAVEVTIVNRILHLIPTAESVDDHGTAALTLIAQGADGAEVGRDEHHFKKSDQTQLVPNEPRVVTATFPAEARKLVLRLERDPGVGRSGLLLHASEQALD